MRRHHILLLIAIPCFGLHLWLDSVGEPIFAEITFFSASSAGLIYAGCEIQNKLDPEWKKPTWPFMVCIVGAAVCALAILYAGAKGLSNPALGGQ